MNTEYDVWLGLDVGKTNHHGCGLDPSGSESMTTNSRRMKQHFGT